MGHSISRTSEITGARRSNYSIEPAYYLPKANEGGDKGSPNTTLSPQPDISNNLKECHCNRQDKISEETRRNLVVCIDGTSNQFGKYNTNVVELYSKLEKGERQLTFYNSGIGTYATPSWKSLGHHKQVIGHKVDLAIAWRFERILLSAYRWLSEVYQDGDRIFLFGFSRGAYQVRALSAMIEKVGLIHRGNQDQITFAYELYCTSADEGSLSQSEHLESHEDMVSTFKETFSRAVKVHFVGAWDTVSSVGLVRSDKNLPLTTSGMKHVCYFRHALAIDERRVKFLPEFAWGSAGPNYEDCKGEMPHTKEVWFAGTHSDIGGGNIPNEELNKKKSTLRWMAREAKKAGLLLDERFDVTLKEGESQEIKESLKGIWWILEAIPFKRLKYVDAKDRDRFTFWPHLGRRRVILNSQRIHQTVYKAHRPGHKKNLPKNRRDPLNDNAELAEPEKVEEDEEEQEDEDEEEEKPADIWSLVDEMVPLVDVTTPEDLVLDRVTIFLEHVHDIEDLPIKELYEELYRLKLAENTNVAQFRAVIVMLVIYAVENRFFSVPEKGHLTAMPAIIQSLLCHTNDRFVGIAKDYIFRHYKSGIKAITTPSPVCSVSISSNGGCIALGEESNDIFVLDIINAGIIYQPLKGHTDRVTSIAFSRQGRMLVSGSDDHTVRIWRLEEKSHTTICVHHNRPEVVAVAFYRNDTHIFSASRDGTILLHDIQRGTFTILVTDSEPVVKATLSPDGSKVVVLSDSGAMRVWDTEKKICISPEYLASDDPISSVEFSVDGSRFFTGNRSGQVHIWNATGEYLDTLAKHPKEGGGTIDTLAASSKYLVANYRANMVQMWDLQVRQPGPSRLFQFSGPILCATFSPRHPSLLVVCSGNCAVEFVDVDGEFVTEILQNEGPGSPFCYFNDSKRRVISSPRRPNH